METYYVIQLAQYTDILYTKVGIIATILKYIRLFHMTT